MSVLIIAIVACLALGEFTRPFLQARVIHLSGKREAIELMHCYYAIHGVWPESLDQADNMSYYFGEIETDFHKKDNESNSYVEDVKIQNGSVDYIFGEDLLRKTLTLRPAVPAGYPGGPVIWVCGGEGREMSWEISGEDRTDIDRDAINRFIR